jgi:amino acid permease
MIFVDIVIYVVWKLWKRPKMPNLADIDLVSGLKEIEDYEANYVEHPPKNTFEKVMRMILG